MLSEKFSSLDLEITILLFIESYREILNNNEGKVIKNQIETRHKVNETRVKQCGLYWASGCSLFVVF